MSNQDLKLTVEAMKSLVEDVASSPEKARAFLVEAGFITASGELTEHYRQSA